MILCKSILVVITELSENQGGEAFTAVLDLRYQLYIGSCSTQWNRSEITGMSNYKAGSVIKQRRGRIHMGKKHGTFKFLDSSASMYGLEVFK